MFFQKFLILILIIQKTFNLIYIYYSGKNLISVRLISFAYQNTSSDAIISSQLSQLSLSASQNII